MLTVRPATSDDLPAVSRIRIRSWQAGYAGILPDELLAAMDVEDDLARRRELFASHGAAFETLVAVHDGAVVGFSIFGPYRLDDGPVEVATLDEREGQIYALYVEPDRWRGGAGKALMAESLRRLAKRGLEPVRLWVLAENARARRFYEAVGFRADGATDVFTHEGAHAPEVRYTHTS